jgi:exopolysaccharide production protein ExoZ
MSLNKGKLDSLEAGRCFAVLLVVLAHATPDSKNFYNHLAFDGLFSFGHSGVDYFFVLSGFIMYFIHSGDIGIRERAWSFAAKRICRIYPIYWIITGALIFLYILLPGLSKDGSNLSIFYIIKSLLLLPIDSSFPALNHLPLLGVAWSLVFEMFFYFLFFILILKRSAGMALLFFWGVAITLRITTDLIPMDTVFSLHFFLHYHNLEFIYGVLIGIFVKKFLNKSHKILLLPGILIFFGAGAIELFSGGYFSTVSVGMFYGLSSGLLILGCCSLERFSKFTTPNFLVELGAASYSIYLTHVPMLSLLNRGVQHFSLTSFINPNIVFLMIVATCMVAGWLFYKVFDLPIQKYLKRRWIKTHFN